MRSPAPGRTRRRCCGPGETRSGFVPGKRWHRRRRRHSTRSIWSSALISALALTAAGGLSSCASGHRPVSGATTSLPQQASTVPDSVASSVPATTSSTEPPVPVTRLGKGQPHGHTDPVIYGVTVDNLPDADPSQLAGALAALPYRPVVRVYFDVHLPPDTYRPGLEALAPHATLMGEILDSSDEGAVSAAGVADRTSTYIASLGHLVSVWEIGNEVNGNWLGSYEDVSSKVLSAYRTASGRRAATALTLYANDFAPDHCGDGDGELTPAQFTDKYVPPQVRDGLAYVFLSYYPDQCRGTEPDSASLRQELIVLHNLYPHAYLGLGEVGLPDPVNSSTVASARQVMAWAYSLRPGLPYFVGGYFWWYAAEDALGPGRPLSSQLDAAFRAENSALRGD